MEEIRYTATGIATRLRKVLELIREIETLLVTLPREDFKDRGTLAFSANSSKRSQRIMKQLKK